MSLLDGTSSYTDLKNWSGVRAHPPPRPRPCSKKKPGYRGFLLVAPRHLRCRRGKGFVCFFLITYGFFYKL